MKHTDARDKEKEDSDEKTLYIIRDIAITVGIQLVCFMVCLWIQNSTVENALIPAVSIFGVFLTSVITPGYLYGVAAAILSVLELNFAFTFPFFTLIFHTGEYGIGSDHYTDGFDYLWVYHQNKV